MSEHAVHAVQAPHDHETQAAGGDGYRFEKSELEFFVVDDRDTGKKIGVLLACLFCILVVLMGSVAIWMNWNQFSSQDPFATPPTAAKPGTH
jgi:hypothetical protein